MREENIFLFVPNVIGKSKLDCIHQWPQPGSIGQMGYGLSASQNWRNLYPTVNLRRDLSVMFSEYVNIDVFLLAQCLLWKVPALKLHIQASNEARCLPKLRNSAGFMEEFSRRLDITTLAGHSWYKLRGSL